MLVARQVGACLIRSECSRAARLIEVHGDAGMSVAHPSGDISRARWRWRVNRRGRAGLSAALLASGAAAGRCVPPPARLNGRTVSGLRG